jgi:hypothetical protein
MKRRRSENQGIYGIYDPFDHAQDRFTNFDPFDHTQDKFTIFSFSVLIGVNPCLTGYCLKKQSQTKPILWYIVRSS